MRGPLQKERDIPQAPKATTRSPTRATQRVPMEITPDCAKALSQRNPVRTTRPLGATSATKTTKQRNPTQQQTAMPATRAQSAREANSRAPGARPGFHRDCSTTRRLANNPEHDHAHNTRAQRRP